MSAGSASCAQDLSLALRPWSCPSSPCQMTSWPTSHGSYLTQRQPVGLHKPAVQVIGSCAIGCQSYERNVRQLLRQLLRKRLQSEGHGAKLCTTALKHQRTVSTTAALLVTSRGARHVAPHCVFAVQAKPANFRITYATALPPKRIRSFDDCF